MKKMLVGYFLLVVGVVTVLVDARFWTGDALAYVLAAAGVVTTGCGAIVMVGVLLRGLRR